MEFTEVVRHRHMVRRFTDEPVAALLILLTVVDQGRLADDYVGYREGGVRGQVEGGRGDASGE